MTRAVRDRILKDANGGDISDHLRNHIHLTNCIHLKNHMHKHSPISMSDRSLIRDLVVLQRSRSLRDPSMSPPSWQSPSAVDLLSKRGERDAVVENGRRSIGIERQSDRRRLSRNSPPLASGAMPKGDPGDGSSNSGVRERRRHKRGESSGRQLGIDLMGGMVESPVDGNNFVHDQVPGNFETREALSKQKGSKYEQDDQLKTLSEQLNEVPMDSDNVASSHNRLHGRHSHIGKTSEEAEAGIRSHGNGRNRVKRRKYRGGKRTRTTIASRDGGTQNEMLSVASNSLAHGPSLTKYRLEEGEEEYAERNVTRAPGNGCGIPWNWSRIHDRGKTFLDIAGRSLSCGLSDPRSKRGGPPPRGREFSTPVMSDHSTSSTKSGVEALPLLIDGSQGSTENAAWVHDYSGELGIFADNLLKREMDSDLASEGRSGDYRNKYRSNNSRHQNLTQRYMPRTFRDLVGQNLVVQALSNAVAKRKVGLLYVFYGPHGTGKTSCARIFARALNCLSVEQPRPCGFCDSCVAHDVGKSRNIKEVGPVSNLGFKNIMELLENMIVPQLPSQYRVFIFDDCDNLSPECWSAISKVTDRAPRRVVFVLVSSSLDVLPHIIISRCQKFFFPKLKDADIIYTLQWIATKEDFEIDKDALKLIASRSDGSLRDAEMTLEQLSLLGQRISVPLVQELVGLISDEKLVDLLDLALSADTVNTVKTLREIMESGVEPLALMSQLATVITDILAGSYDFRKEKPRRKFFRRQSLLKEDMEKVRQALKTLSEAEKQLRLSNDRLTWLTAALLQLAPDQQYMLPSSSADTSLHQSPLDFNIAGVRERPRKSNVDPAEMLASQREFATNVRLENHKAASSGDAYPKMKGGVSSSVDKNGYAEVDRARTISKQAGKIRQEIEELWLEVVERIQTNSLKEFMYQEGKLISISYGEVPCVLLMFSSHLTKSQAEKFGEPILKAFEYVLGQPVTIEIRCSRKDLRAAADTPVTLPAFQEGSSHMYPIGGLLGGKRSPIAGDNNISRRVLHDRDHLTHDQLLHFDSNGVGRSEIIEIEASSREPKIGNTKLSKREVDGSWTGEAAPSNKNSKIVFFPEEKKSVEQNQSQSLVRGKVSLAHVIQQAEGGWSKRKAVSIAEKLEQENLRLEPRSRNLLCWRASRITRRKLSRLKIRTRKPQALLRFVSCGKCLSARSPR